MATKSDRRGAESTDLVPANATVGLLNADDTTEIERLMTEGFAEERTFWIGDPADKKVPVYFGELIGFAGDIQVEPPGAKADEATGVVPTNPIPSYLFHPLDPKTFRPFAQRIDTVLCNHQVARACAKYKALADAKGGKAQILFRWDGIGKTRKGNQMNDVTVIHRIVAALGPAPTGPAGFAPAGAEAGK